MNYLSSFPNSIAIPIPIADAENDSQTILDGTQPLDNLDTHQNAAIIDDPTPRQAIGNEDDLMYLMCLSLFTFIEGNLSVKQGPKANNRLRYQSDGSRFLPNSRYNPMAINVGFFPTPKTLSHRVFFFV